jgi:hypothetical protein
VQERVLEEATANMAVTSPELLAEGLDADGPLGEAARAAAHRRIQETKTAEFHALDLVIDVGIGPSPVISGPAAGPTGRRLPHAYVGTRSLYDLLGPDFTLLCLTAAAARAAAPLLAAARHRRVPLAVLDLTGHALGPRPGAGLLLVRPDQYVAWAGDRVADAEGVLALVTGAGAAV